ncbi:hypothetical protein Mal64_07290 [Pseudobythopirellula maris]|uniref:Motility protein n=1 Tax=Pseudobythopirellula maris TaxID=2527991 RepID=A0A5C5ZTZ5_9BACT|nr:hypothetical protein [Pseudobythopirellula maris]TWT90341.1 hypothetical protein Mal64_07290 [Pseudobythopirellula maris]
MSSISPTSSGAAIESVLAAKKSATQSQVAYAIAGKTLDAQRAAGDAAIALLDAAAPQGVAPGKGAQLDAVR